MPRGGTDHKGGEVPRESTVVKVFYASFLEGQSLGLCFQGQVSLVGGEESRAILSGQDGSSFPAPYRCGDLLVEGQGQRWGESALLDQCWRGGNAYIVLGKPSHRLGPRNRFCHR